MRGKHAPKNVGGDNGGEAGAGRGAGSGGCGGTKWAESLVKSEEEEKEKEERGKRKGEKRGRELGRKEEAGGRSKLFWIKIYFEMELDSFPLCSLFTNFIHIARDLQQNLRVHTILINMKNAAHIFTHISLLSF
jgi:hypothetical protein